MAKQSNGKPKRPSDPNQLAHQLIQEMTTLVEKEVPVKRSEISRVMAEMGRRGGKVGGKKRAEAMTQEQRSDAAALAARARWAKRQKEQ